MKIIISDRIKELMQEQSLNQVQLAERIGVRQNTISAWLLGKKEPCITSLWLLADYFNVDIDYLVWRKEYWNYEVKRSSSTNNTSSARKSKWVITRVF